MYKLRYNLYRGDNYVSFQSGHMVIKIPIPYDGIRPKAADWQALIDGNADMSVGGIRISSLNEHIIFDSTIELKINKKDCLNAIQDLVQTLISIHDPALICNCEMCGHAGYWCKKCKTIASLSFRE